jgi:sirohydrochlorin ferrochelatase
MNEALLIIGHGTRDLAGVEEFLQVARAVADRRAGQATAVAFLEFEQPTIAEAIDQLVADGAQRIVCQPAMLFAASHVKRDVPREVAAARQRWPKVEFQLGRELDGDERLLELCRVRWDEAIARHSVCPSDDTTLLLVARGSSDAGANAAAESIARKLGQRYGVSRAITCFSGVALPLVPDAIDAAADTGCRRIVVQPFLLFNGALVDRIHSWTREAARRHFGLEIISTSHLGVHPLLVDVFESRARGSDGPAKTVST